MSDDINNLNLQRALKNEGVTLILSLVLGLFGFLGVGHIYIDKLGRGFVLLFIGWILLGIGVSTFMFGVGFVLLVIYFVIYIYHVIDARDNARKFNDYFVRTKKELW